MKVLRTLSKSISDFFLPHTDMQVILSGSPKKIIRGVIELRGRGDKFSCEVIDKCPENGLWFAHKHFEHVSAESVVREAINCCTINYVMIGNILHKVEDPTDFDAIFKTAAKNLQEQE